MRLSLKEFFAREIFGEHQDVTQLKDVGASAWSDPEQEVDVLHFFNKEGNIGLEGFEDGKDIREMGGPGSGRKKGSKNKPKQSKIIPGKQVDAASLPDELPDDWFDDMETTMGGQKEFDQTPFQREPGDEGDELSFLDDPNFGAGVELPPRAPKAASAPEAPPEEDEVPQEDFPDFPDFDAPENEDKEFYFDELEEENPKAAADIAAEIGQEAAEKARFTFFGKFTFMETKDGRRWKHSEAAGWLPYDDGKSPTGEF